ncbi:MAG: 30S ribosomal protein S12 methylthiotransferase RimO [Chlamydiia bacterium]|nr:30S ribosomal protein S12 methylthiotransferase RimO [Chlamydiia bacterium]
MSKVSFTSLGCPRNLVDTEVMLGMLLQAGFEITDQLEEADYLVVNTCGFLEASRQESKDVIEELLSIKKKEAKVIVTGCMVSKHKEEVQKYFPGIHFLLGSGDVEGILEAVTADRKGEILGTAKSYLEQGEIPRKLSTPKHYAYLKISEGCRKGCAYCIIPKIKGPLQSKTEDRVVKEFKILLKQGVKEVILIAQDLGDYGKDQGALNGKLANLLRQLLEIPGDYWLRLLYLYPDEITDELLEVILSDRRVCPYLDMPIQHVNDGVLKRMRRKTSGAQIKEIIQKLRQTIPEITIRTSLIVGFPGETEREFDELCEFIQHYPLDQVGIFKYSQEKGSVAAKMEGQVPKKIKEQRFKILAALQQEVLSTYNRRWLGKILPVVIEGYHPETNLLMVGRHSGQCPDIDSQVILNHHAPVTSFGERYLVKITDLAGYDLIGEVLSSQRNSLKSLSVINS